MSANQLLQTLESLPYHLQIEVMSNFRMIDTSGYIALCELVKGEKARKENECED